MSFSEALVHAHSSEENEAQLVSDILGLLKVWDTIESLTEGSVNQLDQIKVARNLVDDLRSTWKLENDEIAELGDHAEEFRRWLVPTQAHTHQAAS